MLIRAYGLFWSGDEIDWHPGQGSRNRFTLLGRRGTNRPNLQLADFRKQSGLYILYGNYGPTTGKAISLSVFTSVTGFSLGNAAAMVLHGH
jgi:hypothetical protein